ncbi:hypothetical protein UlMin_043209 [Ulmus minor]
MLERSSKSLRNCTRNPGNGKLISYKYHIFYSRMQLYVTADTTALSYWLNWRFLLCAIWVFSTMAVALLMIWKYERSEHLKSERGEFERNVDQHFYDDEAWRPCLKQIHPIWLLFFRVLAFCILLATLMVKIVVSGGGIFFYYTQWTFTLLTIYFGFGSLLSIYGCYQYSILRSTSSGVSIVGTDTEEGAYVPLTGEETTNTDRKRNILKLREENHIFQLPGKCTYIFEILYQMNAGAVILTDSVYWFVIFPFLTIKDYNFNLLTASLHTINAILLLGDTVLNCLPIPWFRISFFILWTGVFVIFQWTFHACVSIWWPYPFLDLSSTYAPFWYLLVGLLHIPCYCLFALIVEIKCYLLKKWFPSSCQC